MGSCYSTVHKGSESVGRGGGEGGGVDSTSSDNNRLSNSASKRCGSGRWKKKISGSVEFPFISGIGSNRRGGDGGGGVVVMEHELHRVPGRMFLNGASEVSCLFTQQGRKGTNQDAMLVWENFNSRSDTIFCGVFDGHGPYGHMVAKKVRDSLPLLLCTQWMSNSSNLESSLYNGKYPPGCKDPEQIASLSMEEEWYESWDLEENENLPDMYLPLKQSFLKAFKLMDKELKFHSTIDCFCSGSTAVALVKQGSDLLLGNLGDSRAILATRDKDDSLIAVQLTVDLKPNLPREAARIQRSKGRVFALQDEPEVARVWLPNSDSPGLAMSRAFGDFCLKDFGLTSVPEIYYRRLTERDEFIVLATDGIWDVLSNKEVVDIVASAPGRATAARALVDCAVRAWKLKYPTSKNDDCAVVCLFLEHQSAANLTVVDKDTTEMTEKAMKTEALTDGDSRHADMNGVCDTCTSPSGNQSISGTSNEIAPVFESEEKLPSRSKNPSKRTLGECISMAEDEEWSALEGITRVNSLLSLPRFLSSDKKSASWRKWL
ncbi:PPM-type phosphatase-like domain [Dillenia turbinata]|uniref:protein-serine/threonine phosphatase n=1 Tax=Dillenia turbinata TaxID=194707 RepID=A0AAN8ZBW0_9MAGN